MNCKKGDIFVCHDKLVSVAMPADSRREKIFDFVREFTVKDFRRVPVRDSTQQNEALNFSGKFRVVFRTIFRLKLELFGAVSFCRQAALETSGQIMNKTAFGKNFSTPPRGPRSKYFPQNPPAILAVDQPLRCNNIGSSTCLVS